jgi:MFS family permease
MTTTVPDPNSAGAGGTGAPDVVYDRRWWTLACLCLSLVLIVANNSSLNVNLPVLQRALGSSNSGLQWLVDAYSLVFAGLLLPFDAKYR